MADEPLCNAPNNCPHCGKELSPKQTSNKLLYGLLDEKTLGELKASEHLFNAFEKGFMESMHVKFEGMYALSEKQEMTFQKICKKYLAPKRVKEKALPPSSVVKEKVASYGNQENWVDVDDIPF